MRIAVVGAGISGLSAAWLLSQRHTVVLYERAPRLGGHANTVTVTAPEGPRDIDTGFIVYNTRCYPNLIALFDHLGVPTAPTAMSFAVSLQGGRYEYSGSGLAGVMGQPSNMLKPAHWRMVRDVLRFFREAAAIDPMHHDPDQSLAAWLRERDYSPAFIERHILPMGAAIWSTPSRDMLDFPAAAFARFFANHGLLQVRNRPRWRTVAGGSHHYVARLRERFTGTVRSGEPVASVVRTPGHATVATADGSHDTFDHVVLACHADEALAMLADPSGSERALLASFRYSANEAVLHTDERLMPRRHRLWSSWNYLSGADPSQLAVSYWMNSLQPLATKQDYFVTLNPTIEIDPRRIAYRTTYMHPMFDAAAMRAQRTMWALQGQRNTWFCGSYFGFGFHECGLQSGLEVAERLGGVRRPWQVAGQSDRLQLGGADEGVGELVAA